MTPKEIERTMLLRDMKELYCILGSDALLSVYGLPEREGKILGYRWKANLSFKEIGVIFNVSTERARQIYTKGVRRLQIRIVHAANEYKGMLQVEEENMKLRQENEMLLRRFNALPEDERNIFGSKEALEKKISDIDGISVRLWNTLSSARINTLEDVLKFGRNDFMKFRNCGKKSIEEIESILERYGLKLAAKGGGF